jgi:hypothetical protein
MARFAKGIYNVKNQEKYIGRKRPIYRSSWEFTFMRFLDGHTSILQWSSEAIAIPYRDIITNKLKRYFPDFFIIYVDINGVKHGEIIEIKPANQSKIGKSRKNNALVARNHCKWEAALAYCAKNGLQFRIITELEMFKNGVK